MVSKNVAYLLVLRIRQRPELSAIYRVSQKSEPLNVLQQQLQICSDLNKILHTQDDICYKHYYVVSYKSALTLLKYEFLNNITHKSWVSIAVDVSQNSHNVQPCSVANPLCWWSRVSQLTIAQPSHGHGGLGTVLLEGEEVTRDWTNGWQQLCCFNSVSL